MDKPFAIGGHIRQYDFFIVGDLVKVIDHSITRAERIIDGLGEFVKAAKELRTGWGQFPDGDEVIYFYDKGDENFGYALNLDDPHCSEWGYAPFYYPD